MKLDFSADIMMHPITYLNKLLFAGGKTLELWNVLTLKKIFDFPQISSQIDSDITFIE
jgi:hypothetical protein